MYVLDHSLIAHVFPQYFWSIFLGEHVWTVLSYFDGSTAHCNGFLTGIRHLLSLLLPCFTELSWESSIFLLEKSKSLPKELSKPGQSQESQEFKFMSSWVRGLKSEVRVSHTRAQAEVVTLSNQLPSLGWGWAQLCWSLKLCLLQGLATRHGQEVGLGQVSPPCLY